MKLTSIEISFGSIALSKARNIHIIYKGFELEIEEIALKSNFFNSEISNPVQVFIRDVRINKTIETNDDVFGKKMSKASSEEPIKQIPSFLVTFFQVCLIFLSFRVKFSLFCENLFLVHGHKHIKYFLLFAEQRKRPGVVAAHVTERV